jgi:mRNA interferase MazF
LKRGTIVVVAARGAYTGKPRPALVVQSELFNPTHSSVTLCPITSDCVDAPCFG